jgi:hypothetical protein
MWTVIDLSALTGQTKTRRSYSIAVKPSVPRVAGKNESGLRVSEGLNYFGAGRLCVETCCAHTDQQMAENFNVKIWQLPRGRRTQQLGIKISVTRLRSRLTLQKRRLMCRLMRLAAWLLIRMG